MDAASRSMSRNVHPAIFLVLYLPYGASASYVTVTLVYLLAHKGVSVEAAAWLGALSLLPQTWKALWSPVIDAFLTYKRWYIIAACLTAIGVAITGFIPPVPRSLAWIDGLVLAFSLASTLISMTTDGLIAHAVRPEKKGSAAGWAQSGNLGGGTVGGGVALWLAEHTHAPWIAGLAMALLCVASCTGLAFLAEPDHSHREKRVLKTMLNIVRDVWAMAKSRMGYLAMVLVLLPAGTGAAANLWSAVSSDWRASADLVALVTGVLGGFVSLVGALLAGRILDLVDRKRGYIIGAVAMGIVTLAMAAAPRSPEMFVVFTLLYALFNGYMYAGYSAVMLEAIGRGAAATKSPLFGSLTNMPIALMTVVDGAAQARWGSGGMLVVEAAVEILCMILFMIFVVATRRPSHRLTNQSGQIC